MTRHARPRMLVRLALRRPANLSRNEIAVCELATGAKADPDPVLAALLEPLDSSSRPPRLSSAPRRGLAA